MGATSAWAQYTRDDRRTGLGRDAGCRKAEGGRGCRLMLYYPRPVHRIRPAYQQLSHCEQAGCRCRRGWPGEVLSLPMHPYLTHAQQDRVISAVLKALVD